MEKNNSCACGGNVNLIFSCSGGSDVGALADRSARKLSSDGCGKMYCLAGLGGHISGIIKTTESASSIIAIDGCPLACAKKTLEHAGINDFNHLFITDLGFEKGKTPVDEEKIDVVVKKCKEISNS